MSARLDIPELQRSKSLLNVSSIPLRTPPPRRKYSDVEILERETCLTTASTSRRPGMSRSQATTRCKQKRLGFKEFSGTLFRTQNQNRARARVRSEQSESEIPIPWQGKVLCFCIFTILVMIVFFLMSFWLFI